jgi:hypothetical protein
VSAKGAPLYKAINVLLVEDQIVQLTGSAAPQASIPLTANVGTTFQAIVLGGG